MKKAEKLFILSIIISLISCAGIKVREKGINYLEDAKMYYKFQDYRQAILSAQKALEYDYSQEEKEEALYIINESAEELVTELKRNFYIKPDKWFENKIEEIEQKYDIKIIFKKIGYEYLLYYDKSAYFELKNLNPHSKFIKKIEDKSLARNARFVTDPAYRYKEILRVINQYWCCYNNNPKALYAPSILLRLADLYLYLYEHGPSVKKEIGITDRKIREFYKKAHKIYVKIKKEYPRSEEAQTLGYVIDNVKLRKKPTTKSKVIKRIPAGTMVKIIERSKKRVSISNMYDYWYKVKLIDGLEGWIYGFYLRTTFIK